MKFYIYDFYKPSPEWLGRGGLATPPVWIREIAEYVPKFPSVKSVNSWREGDYIGAMKACGDSFCVCRIFNGGNDWTGRSGRWVMLLAELPRGEATTTDIFDALECEVFREYAKKIAPSELKLPERDPSWKFRMQVGDLQLKKAERADGEAARTLAKKYSLALSRFPNFDGSVWVENVEEALSAWTTFEQRKQAPRAPEPKPPRRDEAKPRETPRPMSSEPSPQASPQPRNTEDAAGMTPGVFSKELKILSSLFVIVLAAGVVIWWGINNFASFLKEKKFDTPVAGPSPTKSSTVSGTKASDISKETLEVGTSKMLSKQSVRPYSSLCEKSNIRVYVNDFDESILPADKRFFCPECKGMHKWEPETKEADSFEDKFSFKVLIKMKERESSRKRKGAFHYKESQKHEKETSD